MTAQRFNIYRLLCAFLAFIFVSLIMTPSVSAQSLNSDDANSIYGDTVWYKPSLSLSFCSNSAPGTTTPLPSALNPTQAQIQIAQTIVGIAKTDHLGQQGAIIGLMTGLTESHLTILANSKVSVSLSYPNVQGVGSNGDSVGVFQQQPQYGWSTIATGDAALSNQSAVWQLMDPAYAAEAFFGSPPGSSAPDALSKGLQNVSGWQSMQPWVAAQSVQHSTDSSGSNYKDSLPQAQDLLNKYWDSSPPVQLPVPIKGNISGDQSGSVNTQFGSCGAPVSTQYGVCTATAPVWGAQNGSGDDYTQEQLRQIYGDPGSAQVHPAMDANLVSIDFLGHQVQVNKLVAPCLSAAAQDIQNSNINYQIRSVGCYRFDSDNGGSNIGLRSYHTYGAACDINPDTNRWSGDGSPLPYDMPAQYIVIFHNHGFTWGGYWVSIKDYMHFEFNGITPP